MVYLLKQITLALLSAYNLVSKENEQVEHILGRRISNGKAEFLVSWRGYTIVDSTWEPIDNLISCSDALKSYLLKSKPIPGAVPILMSEPLKRNHKFKVRMISTRSKPGKRKAEDAILLQESVCQKIYLGKNKRLSESERLIRDTLTHESKTMTPISPSKNYDNGTNDVIKNLMNGFHKDVKSYTVSNTPIKNEPLSSYFKKPCQVFALRVRASKCQHTSLVDAGEEQAVLTEINDRVMTLTLNNTNGRNRLTIAVLQHLQEQFSYANDSPDVDTLIVSNNGDFFCSGIDYSGLLASSNQDDYKDKGEQLIASASHLTGVIASFQKPLIVSVSGPCIGYGLTFILFADFCYATSKVYFELPEVKFGLTPIGGISKMLPKVIGMRKSNAMLLLGERCTSVMAYDHGLVTDVFGIHSFKEDIQKKVKLLQLNNAKAVTKTKHLVQDWNETALEKVIIDEEQTLLTLLNETSTKKRLQAQWPFCIHPDLVPN